MATSHPVNHPTSEPKDHLTALPPELLHQVFDFTLPKHQPDIAFEENTQRTGVPHPLEQVAATCRHLHEEIHSWAKHWLITHADITKYKDLKTAKLQQRRNCLRGRGGLLTWIERHCVFCGKASIRSAILASGMRCCGKCDKEQWPDKITKTNAKTEYDLKDHHLLHGLRYGTYFSCNVLTTMFLRQDIARLAAEVHGDVEAHMSAKKKATEERRKRKEEKAEQKRVEAEQKQAEAEQKRLEWLEKIKESGPFKYAKETGKAIPEDAMVDYR